MRYFLIILFGLKTLLAADWETVNSPTMETIYTVNFINNTTGFISKENAIYKTTTAGSSWYQVYSGDLLVQRFGFLNNIGYAACYNLINNGGEILVTTNLGETWTSGTATWGDGFTDVYIESQSEIYLTAFNGRVFYSSNAGQNWSVTLVNTGYVMCGIDKHPNNNMYALDAFNIFEKSPSGSWQWKSGHGIYSFGDLVVAPNGRFYVGGDDLGQTSAAISYSTNAGQTWHAQMLNNPGAVRSFTFTGTESYAAGDIIMNNEVHGCIWKSLSDSTWKLDYTTVLPSLFGLMQFSQTTDYIYVVGGTGRILKKAKTLTVISNNGTQAPTEFSLQQNYPNPFNPTTTINYTISVYTQVNITVFDINGRKVETLVDKEQNAGSYKINFNAAHLSSGTYFYRISAGHFSETKKMILVK